MVKPRNGFAGAYLMGVLALLSVLSFSVLAIAGRERSRAHNRLEAVRALALATAGAARAYRSGFREAHRTYPFSTGEVEVERILEKDGNFVRLRCRVRSGRGESLTEIGWKRQGGDWRAVYWREMT